MNRPVLTSPPLVDLCRNVARTRRARDRHTACAAYNTGYTLIEILVATTLSLLLLGAVVAMFGTVGGAITDSRSMLEMADRLRLAEERLQMDLAGVTVTMNPPRDPANNEGYFEYIEGPVTAATAPTVARNTDATTNDTTAGDFDDVLMFTTRSTGRPFVGRFGGTTIQSDVAEVAWFVRGRTLHRRVLLVAPSAFGVQSGTNFYANNDISVHALGGGNVAPNTLGDLTRRECRYAHPTDVFPFDVSRWSWSSGGWVFPTLPTLRECSSSSCVIGGSPPGTRPPGAIIATPDFWTNNASCRVADDAFAAGGTRIADDVILTNVIGFDVKAWDPGVVAYVDLGTGAGRFSLANRRRVGGVPADLIFSEYDTWSTHYETVGTGLPGDVPGQSTNGLDDKSTGIVDSDADKLTSPPYPYPLRGIQVKIRVFEPDSRQIREVTVVQDFLPQ